MIYIDNVTYCDCGEMLYDGITNGLYLEVTDGELGICPACGEPHTIAQVVIL